MHETVNAPTGVADAKAPAGRPRYLALDVLRGLTIALMIVVNTPGSWSHIYAPFRHAAWHGFTPTDWVFPSFLFVVGNAMAFSMQKYIRQGHAAFLTKVFKRTALIFLIGLLLNVLGHFVWTAGGDPAAIDLSSVRIMGVLQRIALCYLLAALVIRYSGIRGALLFGLLTLLGYWLIMASFGDAHFPYSLEGNAALKFDLLIFDPENLWGGFGIPFDPEGLLSTLPATVNVIAGFAAGLFIRSEGSLSYKAGRLVLAGLALVGLGLLWGLYFPINKPIWTSSYVLYSTGWTLLVLAALIAVLDIRQWKNWSCFFEAFGKNPLFIYIMSGVVIMLMSLVTIGETTLNGWLYSQALASWLPPKAASLTFAIGYMLLLWLLARWLDRRGIYIKV